MRDAATFAARMLAAILIVLAVVQLVLMPADPPIAIEDPATQTVVLWQGEL